MVCWSRDARAFAPARHRCCANGLMSQKKEGGQNEAGPGRRIYCFNRYGLLVEGCEGIRPGQEPLLRKRADVAGWKLASSASGPCAISLLEVLPDAGHWV